MSRNDLTLTAPKDRRASRAEDPLEPGMIAGAYVVESFVGAGGCGSIYIARHAVTGGVVALKVLHGWLSSQPKVVARFVREVEIVTLLRHPNIVDVHDVGKLDSGRPFFTMEYLRGRTLTAHMAMRGRLSPEEALSILEPVCSALEAAHAAGVVHRDVKPSNVFLLEGKPTVIKLLDFGIAKLLDPDPGATGLTSAAARPGTPSIMAPEQIIGAPVDGRADVYALGVLLFRMLTGNPPFDATQVVELTRQHLEDPPPPPSLHAPIPAALDIVVLRCLEKRPDRRYDSPRALSAALRDALARREHPAAAGEAKKAAAVRVVVRIPDDVVELDSALAADIAWVMDHAEAKLTREGLTLALTTDSEVLAARLLDVEPEEERRQRLEVIMLALALHRELARRDRPDARVHVGVVVHVDEALLRRRGAREEVAGGPLLRLETWSPGGDEAELWATSAAVAGLTSIACAPEDGALVRVLGEHQARSPAAPLPRAT